MGVEVRHGYVGMRADVVAESGDVAAGDTLQFPYGQCVGITLDTAGRTTERHVDQSAFPGGQHRQGGDFWLLNVAVVTNSSYSGPADCRMHDAIAREIVDVAVVHDDGEIQLDHAVRLVEPLRHSPPAPQLAGEWHRSFVPNTGHVQQVLVDDRHERIVAPPTSAGLGPNGHPRALRPIG